MPKPAALPERFIGICEDCELTKAVRVFRGDWLIRNATLCNDCAYDYDAHEDEEE